VDMMVIIQTDDAKSIFLANAYEDVSLCTQYTCTLN